MPTSNTAESLSVAQIRHDDNSPVIIDARRGSMPLNDLLASAGETRSKALIDGKLWIVNVAVTKNGTYFGSGEQTFCIIRPFTNDEDSASMREAFVSQRNSDAKVMPMFEVIGTRSEVRHAITPMFDSDEVLVRWVPAD